MGILLAMIRPFSIILLAVINVSVLGYDAESKSLTDIASSKFPYDERLDITPLPHNHLMSSFHFKSESGSFRPDSDPRDFSAYDHYTVFPPSFKTLMQRTKARNVHLRFTHGFWDAEEWGSLPHDGKLSGGSGVELWAVIEASSKEESYKYWKTLANQLSGLFCASINFIDEALTTYPKLSFLPDDTRGIPVFDDDNDLFLLRAGLANEPICTENLAPLIKLLPTTGKAGISSLLDGHRIFDSLWHSMSIDLGTECDDITQQCKLVMDAVVEMVVHVPTTLLRNENPIPKPPDATNLRCDTTKRYDDYHCFPLPDSRDATFRLSEIFGKEIKGSSLIARKSSQVCAHVDSDGAWTALLDLDNSLYETDSNCFDLPENHSCDLLLQSNDTQKVNAQKKAPIYVSRSLTGYSQDNGGLRTVFTNPGSKPLRLVYYESLPWFMRIYLSTLRLEVNGVSQAASKLSEIILTTYYYPSLDKVRPTHLEFVMNIPANSTIAISHDFDKALLQFEEYPPDANHGFEIESAVVTVLEPMSYQMRTSTLLLLLSTPDFSMPYNVIILTSTVMGLMFGLFYNMLTKRMVTLEEADKILDNIGLRYQLKRLKDSLSSKWG